VYFTRVRLATLVLLNLSSSYAVSGYIREKSVLVVWRYKTGIPSLLVKVNRVTSPFYTWTIFMGGAQYEVILDKYKL